MNLKKTLPKAWEEIDKKQDKTDILLETNSKEIVGAINESLWKLTPKLIGNTSTSIDILEFSINADLGFYCSSQKLNKWTGLPQGISDSGAFFLEIGSINQNPLNRYRFIRITSHPTGRMFINVQADSSGKDWRGWNECLKENSPIFLGNSGVNSITYIQDEGQKIEGSGYVDKTTGSLYLCKVTTTDTSVTGKFVLATNIENRDRISVIEEKLGIYYPVGKISAISVSRDENSSSPTLSYSEV